MAFLPISKAKTTQTIRLTIETHRPIDMLIRERRIFTTPNAVSGMVTNPIADIIPKKFTFDLAIAANIAANPEKAKYSKMGKNRPEILIPKDTPPTMQRVTKKEITAFAANRVRPYWKFLPSWAAFTWETGALIKARISFQRPIK